MQATNESESVTWLIHEAGDKWIPCTKEISETLETAYKRGDSTQTYSLNNNGNISHYKAYFHCMYQQNLQTYFVRRIKRVSSGPPPDQVNLVKSLTEWKIKEKDQLGPDDSCPICLEQFRDEESNEPVIHLPKCGAHYFHQGCIIPCFKLVSSNAQDKGHLVCPICSTLYGVRFGDMPFGHMKVSHYGEHSLSGFEPHGHYKITYVIPSGIQGPEHSNPGTHYTGTMRVAYLPDNVEGKSVLEKLKIAFQRRLTFTIGTSITSGRSNTVVWNGIHHKTSLSGGSFGYPDPTYLQRVTSELAEKGVV